MCKGWIARTKRPMYSQVCHIYLFIYLLCAEACFEPNNAHTKVGNSGLRTAEQLRPNPLIYHICLLSVGAYRQD
jgi:hypothetical protein